MTEFWTLVNVISIGSSALLGIMIGALYGYELSPTHPIVFPFRLWAIGGAFITLLAFLASASAVPTGPGYAIGRFFLWTLLCISIPLGRWLATRIAILLRVRRLDSLAEEGKENGLHR